MRDCLFLLADKNMQAAFEGFLSRPRFFNSLECGKFDFDAQTDLKVASSDNDSGLYVRAHELLSPFLKTHRHAVVVLDAAYEGSPGQENITEHISELIAKTGWKSECFQVIVIDPELENWMWQKNDHVAKALGFDSITEVMEDPDIQRVWPEGQPKPAEPKETMEKLLRKRRIPRSSAIYKQITSHVTIKGCSDSALLLLIETLRRWFPAEAEASGEAAE
jgi:hypothetical protein